MKVRYKNLYTHFVFSTFQRRKVIPERNRERIEKYITGVIHRMGCQLYAIYANPDHVHFLVSRVPHVDEETLTDTVARASARFINANRLTDGDFQWQSSCSAFSVSKANVNRVCKYILDQPDHHKRQTWEEEFAVFLRFYQATIRPEKFVERVLPDNHAK